mgnify:CR=1 FL=1
MRVDLRVKHDIEARKAAIGLFELGHGYKSAAIALSLPVEAVRRWQEIYRAFGSEVLLRMDGKQGRYTYEQKVAAASAVVDGGMTKTEAMAAFGIMSMSPLKKWCALYRRGGAEALRPRPKGRPKGSKARPRTREEELEERCRRLEAEVAYLKKNTRPGREGWALTRAKAEAVAALRAEALKSRHAAPVRLAVLMALPMPLLGAMPYRGVQIFSAWNYWYALFLPVCLSLVVACVARADARTRMRGLLGLGFPLGRAWWAKALWCLALCTLSNLVVFGIYLAGSAFSSQGLTAAGALTMLLCALVNTVTAAWMIPAGLFLTARLGMLAGIFCPLVAQLVGGFAWSLVPLPQLFPPSASMVIPTSFIPVLPSGEPLAADMALGGALAADGMLTLAGLAVSALAFAALTAAGAAWFARSEER